MSIATVVCTGTIVWVGLNLEPSVRVGERVGVENNSAVTKPSNHVNALTEKMVGKELLEQIKEEQQVEFNQEGHGYFVVKGDSMTPNFYEGEMVFLVSESYENGDFVAVTVKNTGEHLLKQYMDGRLISTNTTGSYYDVEDVTVHGKVERVQQVEVEVEQTLQAATGVYVVGITQSVETDYGGYTTAVAYNTLHVLLSNGKVYQSYDNTVDGSGYGAFTLIQTVPTSATSIPVSISQSLETDRGAYVAAASYNSLHVLMSDGKVYQSRDNSNGPGYGVFALLQTIPEALVQPSTGGSSSVPQNRLVGRISAGTGDAEYLSANQTKQLLEATSYLYFPVGTAATSVGMTETRSIDANTKLWKSNDGGVEVHHVVKLYNAPTSTGDLKIN